MIKKNIIFLFIFVIILGLVFLWSLPVKKSGLFEVKEGEGLSQITENLKEQGYIKMGYPFSVYVLLKDREKDLKYGVYQINDDNNFLTVANKIIQGETYTEKITIPEGFTLQQIDKRFSEAGLIQSNELINYKVPDDWVEVGATSLEGFLFPDSTGLSEPSEDAYTAISCHPSLPSPVPIPSASQR